MVEISKEKFITKGKELYGENMSEWKFKCLGCGRIQSGSSIKTDLDKGIKPKRYPNIKRGDDIRVEQECFSPDCNWVAYGLFCSHIAVKSDQEDGRPTLIFPFGDHDFMEKTV